MPTSHFSWRLETRQLLVIALPIISAQLLQVGMGVVDTIMAGQISPLTLAAIALGSSIYTFVLLLGIGVMSALVPTIAQYLGSGTPAKVREELRQGIWLALLLSIILLLASVLLAQALPWFHIDENIIPAAQSYIYWVSWSLPFVYLTLVPRSFNEAHGNTMPLLWIQLLLLPLNILGNYLFMFGHAGLPAMGAAGAALSTALAQVIGCVLFYIYTLTTPRYHSYELTKRMTAPDFKHIYALFRLGLPISISFGMEVGLFTVVALLMGSFGVIQTAGHQIALNVASLTFMIPLGISMALTVQVSHAVGAKQYQLAQQRGRLGILLCASLMLFSAFNLGWWNTSIADLYSDDPAVITMAAHFLIFAALFQLGDGLQVSAAGALRGYKDTTVPMFITTFCYWCIGIGMGLYLSQRTSLGPSGLWLGLVCGLFSAALLLNIRFYRLSQRLNTNNSDSKLVAVFLK